MMPDDVVSVTFESDERGSLTGSIKWSESILDPPTPHQADDVPVALCTTGRRQFMCLICHIDHTCETFLTCIQPRMVHHLASHPYHDVPDDSVQQWDRHWSGDDVVASNPPVFWEEYDRCHHQWNEQRRNRYLLAFFQSDFS